MNVNLSFKERAQIAMEALSKQEPINLEKAILQVKWLKELSQKRMKINIT